MIRRWGRQPIVFAVPAIAFLAMTALATITGVANVHAPGFSSLQQAPSAASMLRAATAGSAVAANHVARAVLTSPPGAGGQPTSSPGNPLSDRSGGSCPVVVANALGACPAAALHVGRAHTSIALCVLRQGLLPNDSPLCGSGFHANDAVVLVAITRNGTTSWRTVADATGSFVTVVPPQVCRMGQATLVATDVHGDRSNSLTVAAGAC